MRNRLFLVLFLLITGSTNLSFAQLVGTSAYLKGGYLEIGMIFNGSFGAPAPPAGYHPHFGNLAEVYDYGHDGWTVGTPAYMGDYTYPGYPFEGWELQWNGTARIQGYQSGTTFTGGATLTATGITSYMNSGGNKYAYWSGTTGPGGILLMRTETRVDTLGSAVVVTIHFNNTSTTATVPQLYYWRSTDPDNDQTWPGGGFFTNNYINFQNATIPNPTHKVVVTGIGASSTTPPLTLATKDCRAVATIYNSWPLTITQDLSAIWNQTYGGGGAYYNVGVNHPGDIGIGLVWKLGDILPGDSTVISYAYVFNGPTGVDDVGALPDPVLAINGSIITTYPDTFNMCSLPTGVDTVNLDVFYGADKDWTWGKWTWTPGTGLSATTGTHVKVIGSFLSGATTYTVSGTDSAVGMMSCNTKKFVITIKPCHYAIANAPCVGDTLKLDMLGDTTGATYYWYGPAGFTSHIRNPFIYPTIWPDTGMYYVVKTHGTLHDSDFIHVILHPLPVVNVTSNIPLTCDPFQNPLTLFASLDSAGETFQWMGPQGFTSTLQNPTITGFDSSMSGTYTVTGTTVWGCKTTKSTSVIPGIKPDFTTEVHYGCIWDTVFLTNYSYNADTYRWIFGDASPDVFSRHTMHVYKASNTKWNVTLNLDNSSSHCHATLSKEVDARHEIHAVFDGTPDTLCLNNGALVSFTSTSYANDSTNLGIPASHVDYKFGDGSTDLTNIPPTNHTYVTPGIFAVTQIAYDAMGCMDSVIHPVYVIQLSIKSFHDTMLCISQPLALFNTVTSIPDVDPDWDYKFSWSQSEPNLDFDDVQIPYLNGIGKFTDILTVTIPGIVPDGCPVMDTININSVLGKKISQLTVSQTIDYGESIQLYAANSTLYYWLPNDGSLDNNNINNPIASPKRTTMYTVFGFDDNGCKDSAYVTVYVDTTMDQDIPSAFTPDGDGLNDVFKPVGIKFQHLVEMRVYNRWGQELYYTNNKEEGWDGTYHGSKQDMGVYSYLIIVAKPGQDNIIYKGNVTLIR